MSASARRSGSLRPKRLRWRSAGRSSGWPGRWAMSDDGPDILRLARSILDGSAVDWKEVEKRAAGDDEIALIERLRLLSKIIEVHRSQPPPGRVPRAGEGS